MKYNNINITELPGDQLYRSSGRLLPTPATGTNRSSCQKNKIRLKLSK